MNSGADRRKWARRSVNISVRLLFPTAGLRHVHEASVRLKDISEGGAMMEIGTLANVPDFFYLQFGNDKSEMIGCYVAGRLHGVIRAQFCNELTTAFVDKIVSQSRSSALGGEAANAKAAARNTMRVLFNGS